MMMATNNSVSMTGLLIGWFGAGVVGAALTFGAPVTVQAAEPAATEKSASKEVGPDDPRIQLLTAILKDDGPTVHELLEKGVDPNIREMDRGPAIVMAVREKSTQSLRELLASPKLKVDALNDRGETALMMASMIGNAETVSLLIEKGAEVDRDGWSPLHYAASNGRNDIVKVLIAAGADIDARSPNGSTPLMMAARRGNLTPYQTLLLAGADPRPANDSKLTAADYLERIGENRRAALLRSYSQNFDPTLKLKNKATQ